MINKLIDSFNNFIKGQKVINNITSTGFIVSKYSIMEQSPIKAYKKHTIELWWILNKDKCKLHEFIVTARDTCDNERSTIENILFKDISCWLFNIVHNQYLFDKLVNDDIYGYHTE